MADGTESKRMLLEAETERYLSETLPAFTTRWEAISRGADSPILRELTEGMQALIIVTNEANRDLADARAAAAESQTSSEPLMDRALASLERLNEAAEGMMERLDELVVH
jgi:hypothetical protein